MERPPVPAPEAMRFRVRLRTRWSDEDNHGVMNNAVFLTLLEEARFAYFAQLGELEENRFPFVLAQCNVAFLAPGRGGREVEVELATTHLGLTSFTQAYRVRDPATGTVLSWQTGAGAPRVPRAADGRQGADPRVAAACDRAAGGLGAVAAPPSRAQRERSVTASATTRLPAGE